MTFPAVPTYVSDREQDDHGGREESWENHVDNHVYGETEDDKTATQWVGVIDSRGENNFIHSQ